MCLPSFRAASNVVWLKGEITLAATAGGRLAMETEAASNIAVMKPVRRMEPSVN
jgi:hypothetical protein